MARILVQNDRTGVRVEVGIDGERASAKCLNCHWQIHPDRPIPISAALVEADLHVDFFPHPEVSR